MNTQACPYCSIELPDQALFCPMCAKQIRCKSCREMLWANARACISCGVLVGDSGDVPSDVSGTQPNAINRIVFKDHKRSLEANLTDESIRHMSGAVGQFISNRIFEEQPPRHMEEETYIRGNTDQSNAALPAPQPHSQIEQNIVDSDFRTEVPSHTKDFGSGSDRDKLRRVFRQVGDRLGLDDTRLKAKDKSDYARRLVLLFLYTHYLDDQDSVSRSEINAILNDASVYNNSKSWIANTHELRRNDSDKSLSLNAVGRDAAHSILQEVFDPELTDQWHPGLSSRRRTSTSTDDKTNDRVSKGTNSKEPEVSPSVSEWVNAVSSRDWFTRGHDLLVGKSNTDKAIFALWAIRTAAPDDGKIVSQTDISAFLYAAFEFKIVPSNIGRALRTSAAKGKVINVSGAKYQIQPPGMKHAEEITGISSDNTSPENS